MIGGNASTALHAFYYLSSPVIDVSGQSNLTLEFYRWLNSDYTPFMQNTVDVFNGTQWIAIWQSGGAPGIVDSSWVQQAFDISAHINPALAIRFGHQIGSGGVYTVSS